MDVRARSSPYGEQFLTHAVRVLDAINTAGQSLNPKEGLNNDVVRVGALPTAALGILPSVIGQFHQQQKETTLQVATMSNTMIPAGLKNRGNRYWYWPDVGS